MHPRLPPYSTTGVHTSLTVSFDSHSFRLTAVMDVPAQRCAVPARREIVLRVQFDWSHHTSLYVCKHQRCQLIFIRLALIVCCFLVPADGPREGVSTVNTAAEFPRALERLQDSERVVSLCTISDPLLFDCHLGAYYLIFTSEWVVLMSCMHWRQCVCEPALTPPLNPTRPSTFANAQTETLKESYLEIHTHLHTYRHEAISNTRLTGNSNCQVELQAGPGLCTQST